jgi:pimeloyl-ACP methyl ester carboxylesterase
MRSESYAEAPGSRLTMLEDVGHYPMLEAPRRWTDALLGLLA